MGTIDGKAEVITDLEEIYLDSEDSYSEVTEAIKESEKFFKDEIILPTRLPKIAFTHIFGRFSNFSTPILEITYLDEKSGYTHYQIDIVSIKDKIPLPTDAKKINLHDGNEAFYFKRSDFTMFVIEKENFQYTFRMDNNSAEQITIDGMVKIANSMR